MVIILYPVLIDSNCSFAFQYWNCRVFSPYFQETAIYFIAGDCLFLGNTTKIAEGLPLPGFSMIMGSTRKLSVIQKASRKQGGVGARTQDNRVRRSNVLDSLGKLHTLSGWVFCHLQRGGRKLIQTLIPLVPFSQLFYFWGGVGWDIH